MTAATDTATVPARLEFDGTDLDAAVDGAILPEMRNGGRTCTAADRSGERTASGSLDDATTRNEVTDLVVRAIPASAGSKDIAVS